MLCPHCQQEFDNDSHLPRILIFCGHTYCHSCIVTLLDCVSNGLNCPECKTLNVPPNGVESFPKNLVLLSVPLPQQQPPPQKKAVSPMKPRCCTTHQKKLEAFCEKDKEVLCIDCILSDKHKSHEIIAIQKAAEKQRVFLLEEVTVAQKTEEKLRYINTDIKKYISEMHIQVEKNRSEVSQIYNQLRELLLEREQQQKKQISDTLVKEEEDCKDGLSQISDLLGGIQRLKQEMIGASDEEDLDLVTKAKERYVLCSEVNGQQAKDMSNYNISQVCGNQSFIEIKKENELIQISKLIHPQFKGNVSSTLYSHTASTANKVKKNQGPQNQPNLIVERESSTQLAKAVDNRVIKDDASKRNKISKKQSPHRNTRVNNKKPQVFQHNQQQPQITILDQKNKQKSQPPLSKVPSDTFHLKHLTTLPGNEDDSIEESNVVDDMSSIHPSGDQEPFYQYSPKRENHANLNDLLESLDKSLFVAQQNKEVPHGAYNQVESAGESSTTQEEKAGARSRSREGAGKLMKVASQKMSAGFELESKIGRKEQRTPSVEAGKHIISLYQQDNVYGAQERKGSFNKRCRTQDKRAEIEHLKFASQNINHTKENPLEPKRKHAFRSPSNGDEGSPSKKNEAQNLLMMLQEATKSIEKLEFKQRSTHKDKKPTASICLVDLSKDLKETTPVKVAPLVEEEEDIEDGTCTLTMKPLVTSPPQKHTTEDEQPAEQSILSKYELFSSPNKFQAPPLNESPQKAEGDTSVASGHLSFQSQNEVSCNDPFKALCKIKEEFIFAFSGFNDSKLFTCEVFDVSRGIWKEIQHVTKPRTKFSAVSISKSRILLFGGKQIDGQRTGEIEEYNLKTNKFKVLPFKMPKPRSGFASCVKKEEGKIFFCGGNSGSVLRKFDCLDLKKGKWSRLPDMIQKRDELAVAMGPDGMVYAIGGYGGGGSNQDGTTQQSNCLQTAERFNFTSGQWEMLPPMNEARRALAAIALPDGIYAIGGYDGKQYLSTVEKFDLNKQQWEPVKQMNQSRCTLSAVASSDCQYIYALGGFNGTSLDIVERYNSLTDEWDFMSSMLSKRFMHEAVNLVSSAFSS